MRSTCEVKIQLFLTLGQNMIGVPVVKTRTRVNPKAREISLMRSRFAAVVVTREKTIEEKQRML